MTIKLKMMQLKNRITLVIYPRDFVNDTQKFCNVHESYVKCNSKK